jgi:membrane associated rhomboid family serine protease
MARPGMTGQVRPRFQPRDQHATPLMVGLHRSDGTIDMTLRRTWPRFFEVPHTMVFLMLTLNLIMFGVCLMASGGAGAVAAIPLETLLRDGAMYSGAIDQHQYWRLVAYGFLHADASHLAVNMVCLVLWGGHLEKRVGSFYFLLIYMSSVIAAALVSNASHHDPYLSVGASGAVSGVFGALFSLWVLGKSELSASFYVINLGLNVALAFSARNVDAAAHLGGFTCGVICCALLDLIEKANAVALRCKFPEFAKLNIFLLAAAPIVVVGPAAFGEDKWSVLAGYGVACVALIKLVDIILSMKRGLVVAVLGFAALNAALAWVVAKTFAAALTAQCARPPLAMPDRLLQAIQALCANMDLVMAGGAFALTLLLNGRSLARGISDVGFVATTLRAERKRRAGI